MANLSLPRSILAVLLAVGDSVSHGSFSAATSDNPYAQQEKPPASPVRQAQGPIRAAGERVVVPVTVKDAAGKLVAGIGREEFRILEDKVEQEITLFSAEPAPLSVVLLIDKALPRNLAQNVQQSVSLVASSLSEGDEAAGVLFDEFAATAFELTRDNDKVYEALKRLEIAGEFPGRGSGPMTSGPRINTQSQTTGVPQIPSREARRSKNIDDAVFAAGEVLQSVARERRKIILLVSDGENSRNNSHTFDATARLLLSYDVQVYAVGLGDSPRDRPAGVLARYARHTGGDLFHAKSRAELEPLYARITEQARNQYALGYVPRPAAPEREYRDLEVKVLRPNLTVLAPYGYYVK